MKLLQFNTEENSKPRQATQPKPQCNNQKRKRANSAEDTIPMTCKKKGKVTSLSNDIAGFN